MQVRRIRHVARARQLVCPVGKALQHLRREVDVLGHRRHRVAAVQGVEPAQLLAVRVQHTGHRTQRGCPLARWDLPPLRKSTRRRGHRAFDVVAIRGRHPGQRFTRCR